MIVTPVFDRSVVADQFLCSRLASHGDLKLTSEMGNNFVCHYGKIAKTEMI